MTTLATRTHTTPARAQKFGDVDMSSGKNMFSSIRNSTAAKHAAPAQIAPPTPPAFQRKNDFAPPPRRVPSTSASSPATSPAPPAPPALPRRNTQEEGEWVEALYDYHSEVGVSVVRDAAGGLGADVLDRTLATWICRRACACWWWSAPRTIGTCTCIV